MLLIVGSCFKKHLIYGQLELKEIAFIINTSMYTTKMIYVQFILNFFPVKTRGIQDGKTCQMCGEGVAFNSWFF